MPATGRDRLLAADADCSHLTPVSGLLADGPKACDELRTSSDDASSRPCRRRRRRAVADTAIAGTPIATATARASQEKGDPKRDQQERADQVKHPDGDEPEVLGDAERTDDDECEREDSHDLLQANVRRWVRKD